MAEGTITSISITADTSQAQAQIEKLRKKMELLTNAMVSTTTFKKWNAVTNALNNFMKTTGEKMSQNNIDRWYELGSVLTSFTPSIFRANAAIISSRSAFGSAALALAKFTNAMKTIAMSVAPAVKGTYELGRGVYRVAKYLLKIPALPFRGLASSVKDATKRLRGFFSAVKRVAVYRAIRLVLKEISQAFKEGIDNLYQYSKAINGVFAQSMDTLATSALYAKNSLAAMASPLINALAPAIDFIVDKFVDFINTINQLIATLTGAQTWTKALKYPKEYAEAADGANGKAKELRATLLGFDEINRLDDNRNGSRGSAAEELDYSKMFEEQEVSSKVKGLAQRIKDAFLEGDFYDLGNQLGEKIRNGLNDIPWDKIQDRIKKNALSASSFINGIVDTEGLPEALGDTLANAFNTITMKIKTFFSDVKWKKVGKAVGDTLSTAVSKIDKQQLADALLSVLSAAFDLALGMIEASPVIGTIAVVAIGSKLGLGLGKGMATGFASSGFIAGIPGLLGGAMVVGAGIVGYELYKGYQKIHDAYIDLFTDIPEFAEKQTAWFYEQVERHERNYQFLIDQGYSKRVADNALWAQGILEDYDNAILVDEAFGWIYKKQRDINAKTEAWNDLTDKEKKALQDLIKQEWTINFTTKFGKTPQEMAQEWMENLKTKLQPVADALKKAGNDWGKAIKDGLLDIFSGDGIKNQIKKCLPTSMSLNVTVNGSTSNSANYVKGFAGGGDPVTGSMFIAGERGAELVSSSSSGTSVYNRNQIADSVASGNEQTVAALNELISIGQALLEKDTSITTDSISNALGRSNIRAGRTVVVTGG